jgi:hypothetical protein
MHYWVFPKWPMEDIINCLFPCKEECHWKHTVNPERQKDRWKLGWYMRCCWKEIVGIAIEPLFGNYKKERRLFIDQLCLLFNVIMQAWRNCQVVTLCSAILLCCPVSNCILRLWTRLKSFALHVVAHIAIVMRQTLVVWSVLPWL